MKIILGALCVLSLAASAARADTPWEKQGNLYYLKKDSRSHFSATAPGGNKFSAKYLTYDGVDFLVRGAQGWKDYGRISLEGNAVFRVPIPPGTKTEEIHFLAGGNFGNSYKHDLLLRLYGDNYYYGVITVTFAYQDGTYQNLSVPIFWDWFHLGKGEWTQDGAKIISVGNNPVRKDCNMYHLTFANPRPAEPLKDILVADSWLKETPYSDIFAVTLRSADTIESVPRTDRQFPPAAKTAQGEPPDNRTEWLLDGGLDGWISGSSENWDVDPAWQAESYGQKGGVLIPACNWGGDKFSWIEKKVTLPKNDKLLLQFSRHSATFSEQDKSWSDGLLRVIVTAAFGPDVVYEKLYSGPWSREAADLSPYKGQTVIIRFENHGSGQVRLGPTTSPTCDAEDALIDDIRVTPGR